MSLHIRVTSGVLLIITGTLFLQTANLVLSYRIGVGRNDCTGPPVEVPLMGYGQFQQRAKGIHLRQFARAFIVQNESDNSSAVVFVSVDAGMIGHAIKRDVVNVLRTKLGNLYTMENVVISGTHTHAGPAGYLMHFLYDLTSLGFIAETYNALVGGIWRAILMAHRNMQKGRIYVSETDVQGISDNRSPHSYAANPTEERAQYDHSTDKKLTQLRFVNSHQQLLGVFNWFAIHANSMNNSNRLVSSDNVGYASYLMETELNEAPIHVDWTVVGAFASSNLGDVTPNIMQPRCSVSGLPCNEYRSSCASGHGKCISHGPGRNMFESTKIIGRTLYKAASKLVKEAPRHEVTGDVAFIHQFVYMPSESVQYFNPRTKDYEMVRGCLPALGHSFAAGTTDGPGELFFQQGTTNGEHNPLWDEVRNIIAKPSPVDIACHHPKPILLATGEMHFPYEWQPSIVPIQLLRLGNVIISALPGEFTTMAGRRIRRVIHNSIVRAGGAEPKVILAGLSNMYTSYVVTPEEYQLQRYEAASTIFGPHTLTIYMSRFAALAEAMQKGIAMDPGPMPPNLANDVISLQPDVYFDTHPKNQPFGTVLIQTKPVYKKDEIVGVRFVAANPRNDVRRFGKFTFLTVEKMTENGEWVVIRSDADWDTMFTWTRLNVLLGTGVIDITWAIGDESGVFRIRHMGVVRPFFGELTLYNGVSMEFSVLQ